MLGGWCSCITIWPSLLSVWTTFPVFEFALTSLTILLSCQIVATKYHVAILVWYVSISDHSTELMNTIWKMLLTTYIVVLQYVLWAKKSFNSWTDVNRLSQYTWWLFPVLSSYSFNATLYPRPNSEYAVDKDMCQTDADMLYQHYSTCTL